jgi:O-antigen/teichoic acid export membrane protein
MTPAASGSAAVARGSWAPEEDRPLRRFARNVATRYMMVTADMVIGLLTLPFNLHHLGTAAYGLWMLTAGVTIHFSILDLGYGGAMVKFVAQYRAHKDTRALNEIASTLFFVFAGVGILAYLAVIALAFNLGHIFRITPEQAVTARWILLIIGVNVAINFPFSVYGGVSNGFQRYDINNLTAIVANITATVVGVAVLLLGFGLLPFVFAMTTVRVAAYFVYRRNAYTVFPALRISPSLFRRARLREATGFSIYASIIDWANKLNYELDEIVVGIFLPSTSVAVWAVADRIVSGVQRLTNQGNTMLLPVVVDSDATNRASRLQRVLLEGTRLSLASVVPVAMAVIVLAEPLIRSWLGREVLGAVPVVQVLAFAVALRVGNATSTTVLKGSGRIRDLAMVNIVTGIVNLALSALLIRPFGLVGVAVGTLIPVAIASIFVIFPAACRRVDVPIAHAFRFAVWPAAWPAAVAALGLYAIKQWTTGSFLAVVAEAGIGIALYLGLFVLAIGRRDRGEYIAKLMTIMGRGHRLVPAS